MADKESWKKEEEEEEEDYDESTFITQKDAVLFAIDVSKTMLTDPPPSNDKKAEKDSPTLAAIKCAYQIMQQRIISSPKDMMGVLLFGTEQSKFQDEDASSRGGIQYPHCYLLSDLNIPDIEDVKTLKGIVENEEGAREILEPTREPVSMSNMLFCANQIFTTRAPNFGSRRLFIITDKDDPHAADKNMRNQAQVRAKDLYDLGVIIELFPISHPDHEFDRSKFYDDIIYRDAAEGSDLALPPTAFKSQGGGGISLLSTLISDINSKQVAKRSLFSHMPFEIGPSLKITVKGYNLLQKQAPARNCFIWAGGETLQIAQGETKKFSGGDVAREVQKVEIKKAYKFGGTNVMFNPEEQKELKNFGPPVLRIIGFKPRSMLKIQDSVKKSTFIYPSEEDYVGSTRVFAALWKKLVKSKIMGVAWFIARSNASPALVAILPSEERFDDSRVQVIPAGLWLYPLPFADDIREPGPVPKPLIASEELTTSTRKIVQQLQLPGGIYDPSKYPNPSLQWHYKIIQAMALEDEIPTVQEDKTMPKFRQIDKRAGEYINEWGKILDEEARASQKSRYGGIDGTDLKRGSDDDDGPPKKKIKVEKNEGTLADMSVDDLKNAVERGTLKKFTLADLRDWLKTKGLSSSGKKQDLIDRIEQWVEDH
ncbi:ku70 protein [Mollisia scopiformis]|uniref:ATP-dependent DNA helicase II subunit 1 n=1 Tax=Mollisia scopiformis TaxID=149040 RepID=A0A194X326_MOLSC|nr:ku70 protein [Mollisia scopiformis]KUJ14232.1 ku70 protein [Mollisia scopiformis]